MAPGLAAAALMVFATDEALVPQTFAAATVNAPVVNPSKGARLMEVVPVPDTIDVPEGRKHLLHQQQLR